MKKVFLWFPLVVLLSGCATTMDYKYYGTNPEFKSDPRKMILTESDIPDRKYEVLGEIKATSSKSNLFSPDPTREQVDYLLKRKASRLGADGIIKMHYGTVRLGVWSWGELDGSGTAIKFIE